MLNALAYFADPDDLIPDRVPGLGYLDDAIMVELVVQDLKHEIEAFDAFVEFRTGEAQGKGRSPPSSLEKPAGESPGAHAPKAARRPRTSRPAQTGKQSDVALVSRRATGGSDSRDESAGAPWSERTDRAFRFRAGQSPCSERGAVGRIPEARPSGVW